MKVIKKLFVVFIIFMVLIGLLAMCSSPKGIDVDDNNTKALYSDLKVQPSFENVYVKKYGSGKGTYLEVSINFKDDIMSNGNAKAIENLIDKNLAGKYDEYKIEVKVFTGNLRVYYLGNATGEWKLKPG